MGTFLKTELGEPGILVVLLITERKQVSPQADLKMCLIF
jgi:hypothetical protein